ncbi:asparaginase [Chlorobium sp.]|uniref:asparaginase n=1 Tax=Chlorobium sp. TaxID=1095 RepID=UPI002F3E3C16
MRYNVALLYTGGTIGCEGFPLAPVPGEIFRERFNAIPWYSGGALRAGCDEIVCRIEWIGRPADSSDLVPLDWLAMAVWVLERYDRYDGFVILHGTDTMSWSASALSFLLQGLSKPVVFTGSQLPLFQERSDAAQNLLTSVILAATFDIPEVSLFFDHLLFRGNRSVKVDARSFSAFASPNYPELGRAGTEIVINRSLHLDPPAGAVSLDDPLNRISRLQELSLLRQVMADYCVVALTLFPGIPAGMIDALLSLSPRLRGIVLKSFGSGNAPVSGGFIDALARAREQGVVVVDATQVLSGTVRMKNYETGYRLQQSAHAVCGHDLTAEAALAKLICLTGKALIEGCGTDFVETGIETLICGEMTL